MTSNAFYNDTIESFIFIKQGEQSGPWACWLYSWIVFNTDLKQEVKLKILNSTVVKRNLEKVDQRRI